MSDLTKNTNYFQPNKFKLIVDRLNYPNFEFFAQTVSMPSIEGAAAEAPFMHIEGIPMPPDALSYAPFNVTILLDEDMEVYRELHAWLRRLVYEKHTTAQEALRDGSIPTMCDITVMALTSHNNKSVTFRYKDAFPVSIGEIELNASEQSIEPYSLNVVFRYTDFEIDEPSRN